MSRSRPVPCSTRPSRSRARRGSSCRRRARASISMWLPTSRDSTRSSLHDRPSSAPKQSRSSGISARGVCYSSHVRAIISLNVLDRKRPIDEFARATGWTRAPWISGSGGVRDRLEPEARSRIGSDPARGMETGPMQTTPRRSIGRPCAQSHSECFPRITGSISRASRAGELRVHDLPPQPNQGHRPCSFHPFARPGPAVRIRSRGEWRFRQPTRRDSQCVPN